MCKHLFHSMNKIILEWYKENKRDLPWRRSKDPYAVWVSEIMLQQTRVEAVKPYFKRFMDTLPTITDLAYCEEEKLLKLWEGLGYYSRVLNMKKAAMICVEKYNGNLPTQYEELLTLPGIGVYSASAIASIAYGENRVALDGNVLRIYARLLNIQEDIYVKKTQNRIYSYFEENPCNQMGDLNQALMDFGSAICFPNASARCNICPLITHCEAYKNHTQFKLPIKKEKKSRRKEKYTVLLYVHDHKVLLHKRTKETLLKNMYEFVMVEGHKTKKEYPKSKYLGKYKHIFTHLQWDMKGFLLEEFVDISEEDYIWVDIDEIQTTYSIPSAFTYFKNKIL